MDTDTALKTFSLANDVRELDAADEMLVFDKAEAQRIDKEAPWRKELVLSHIFPFISPASSLLPFLILAAPRFMM